MENILIDIRGCGYTLENYFKDKDLVSVEALLTTIEDLVDEVAYIKEEYEDFKRDVEDNYRPISYAEQVGVSDRDFI